jgi:dihydropteroate synthase
MGRFDRFREEETMLFRARQFEFAFPRPVLVMGVINITPDSFSDGGMFFESSKAVDHALLLVEQGAEILDIGGESSRPGAEPVDQDEEMHRVIPIIEKLASRIKIPISIDTTKPTVARAALEAGASIVNDVAANRDDDRMWHAIADVGAGYVAMHMQGDPKTMQSNPTYSNVVDEIEAFFQDRLKRLRLCGVNAEQVVLDAGIGFGKTPEHNLQLLAGLSGFTWLGRPLLVGVSRKSFIGKLLGADIGARLPASLACASMAVASGVQIVRTHDVAETVQAVRMTEAILSRRKS